MVKRLFFFLAAAFFFGDAFPLAVPFFRVPRILTVISSVDLDAADGLGHVFVKRLRSVAVFHALQAL
jgi:hypothetical protein